MPRSGSGPRCVLGPPQKPPAAQSRGAFCVYEPVLETTLAEWYCHRAEIQQQIERIKAGLV